MELTKYNHATVVLAQDGATLVIDPGTFTPESAELVAGATAVLVTHEHGDHFDAEAIRAGLATNPALIVHGPATVLEALGDHGGRVVAVSAGDAIEAGPFSVQVFGAQHAVIHPDMPAMANVGYLVNGDVFHPGDAYLVPGVPVRTLLVPTSGPWTSLRWTIDYVREVAPERGIQIHEMLLSDMGQQGTVRMLGSEGLGGVPTEIVPVGTSVSV